MSVVTAQDVRPCQPPVDAFGFPHPEFVSLPHLQRCPWFLPTFVYDDLGHLLASLDIVAGAEAKVKALEEAVKEARCKIIEAELIKPR